jgi:3'(2'), 5'-bisphosphate nucleotidase
VDRIIKSCLNAGILASKKILEIYNKDFEVDYKEDKSPVTIADTSSSEIIERELASLNLPFISEENPIPDYSERKDYTNYFLVDPLDGTKEFVNRTGEFCVNIAYVENSIPVLGFLFDPLRNSVLYGGSYSNEVIYSEFNLETNSIVKSSVISNSDNHKEDTIRLITSRRANFDRLENYASKMYGSKKTEFLTKGSALKFIDLAIGKADIYPRFGNTMEWDIAPGFAILKQLNGSINDMESGNDMKFNKVSLLNSHFIAFKGKKYE